MYIFRLSFLAVGILFLVACQSSETKIIKSNHLKELKRHVPKKEKKEKIIMDEYEEMKRNLEPQGYVVTTDSVNYIYLDHSVKLKFN
jgi:hypothetical protein